MYSIGIDIGTTSICAVLMNNQTGEIVCSSVCQNNSFIETDKNWEKIQDISKIEEKVFEASAGGGKVTVSIKGTKEVTAVKIAPEIVDPDDVEMLEDLVTVAVNDAIRQVEASMEEGMSAITGGLNLPGLF